MVLIPRELRRKLSLEIGEPFERHISGRELLPRRIDKELENPRPGGSLHRGSHFSQLYPNEEVDLFGVSHPSGSPSARRASRILG